MIDTRVVRIARPVTIPATARSVRAPGRVTPLNQSTAIAITGRAMRARTFHTPVTTTEVEVARRENPHERQIAYVAASPTAPPPGRRLETDDPHRLTTSALLWVSPGSEPVKVKV
jgi:hypothetical protein